jgi:hypothetical protein
VLLVCRCCPAGLHERAVVDVQSAADFHEGRPLSTQLLSRAAPQNAAPRAVALAR